MRASPWIIGAFGVLGCAADDSPRKPALPRIHDASGASSAHVESLVRRALDGLGFDPNAPEGPNAGDRVFVGRRYLAWIDETGFYGKLNGLWVLDGAEGDALELVVKDGDGRPVNLFVPGENGEGRFPPGYQGAEHLEFPSRVPEPDDDPACVERDWCNQYSLAEAVPISNPSIPSWSACNANRPSFTTKHEPVLVATLPDGGLKVVYEGPLVKEADGDGVYDGDACHEDYLFPDGQRRRVLVRVGYELHPDADYIDRTQQLVNPPGNPALSGDMSLIGGFVMTAYPAPHYLKRWDRFWRPEKSKVKLTWGDEVMLPAATWTSLVGRPRPLHDVIVGWADQPFTVAPFGDLLAGRTVTIENVGPSDNADVGACLCRTHGGIELGGGLLHAGISLPVMAGEATIEARRRLTLPRGAGTGSARVIPAGPMGDGAVEAVVAIAIDRIDGDDLPIVSLDLYDLDEERPFATRIVRRSEFRAANQRQRFTLDVSLDAHTGHAVEARLSSYGTAAVEHGDAILNYSDR